MMGSRSVATRVNRINILCKSFEMHAVFYLRVSKRALYIPFIVLIILNRDYENPFSNLLETTLYCVCFPLLGLVNPLFSLFESLKMGLPIL